ncbi:MAG: thiamine phosphate synthase [Bacteroidota bacterium]
MGKFMTSTRAMRSISENKKLIVISHPGWLDQEAKAISSLFQTGLKYFHLRKPNWETEELEHLLQKIPEEFYANIILHNHYELVKIYGLKGVHITRKTKNTDIEEKFEGYHISISTHSEDEVILLGANYDYAFISPVFNSISKEGHKSGFSVDNLSNFFSQNEINTEIIALGGINPDNIKALQNIPFSGYAVLGCLWKNFSQYPDMENLQKQFSELKKSIYE